MPTSQWQRAKSRLRQGLYRAAWVSGLNRLVGGSRWRRERLLILCYHGFSRSDEHLWDPELYIQPETFRRRLRLLGEAGAKVLPLPEALARLEAGTLSPMAVAITVDDGAMDFLLVAYPIIREFRVPVTVYVPTYHVFNRLPVFDVCARYLLWKAAASGRTLSGRAWPPGSVTLDGGDRWKSAGFELRNYVLGRGLSAGEKQSVLVDLAAALEIDLAALQQQGFFHLMAPGDLAALDPALVDLQLHTHRHRMPADAGELRREIEDNRAGLERCGRGAKDLVHFCYPSGVYRHADLPVLRSAGIVSATTGVPGFASRVSEPLLLPRFVDNEGVSEAAFRAWLSGAGALLGRRRWP